jgi:hypothetical protein
VCLNIHLNALGIAVANGIDTTRKEEKKTKKRYQNNSVLKCQKPESAGLRWRTGRDLNLHHSGNITRKSPLFPYIPISKTLPDCGHISHVKVQPVLHSLYKGV